VTALRGQAWCARESGEADQALDALQRAREVAAAAGLEGAGLQAAVDEAQVWISRGDLDRAQQRLGDLDLRAALPATAGEALSLRAHIAARQRHWARADELASRALVVLRAAGQPRPLGAALYAAGQIAGALGDGARAGALLGEALGMAVRAGLPEQAMIRATLDRMTQRAPTTKDPP
ncbi:MAG: hypothetical protein FJ100_13315, partial [Deltaproteobacteria bacterium]|nr:hypothetical protein [Deltaproteobacteria bacterium]